jgi:hypothetical protein
MTGQFTILNTENVCDLHRYIPMWYLHDARANQLDDGGRSTPRLHYAISQTAFIFIHKDVKKL